MKWVDKVIRMWILYYEDMNVNDTICHTFQSFSQAREVKRVPITPAMQIGDLREPRALRKLRDLKDSGTPKDTSTTPFPLPKTNTTNTLPLPPPKPKTPILDRRLEDELPLPDIPSIPSIPRPLKPTPQLLLRPIAARNHKHAPVFHQREDSLLVALAQPFPRVAGAGVGIGEGVGGETDGVKGAFVEEDVVAG